MLNVDYSYCQSEQKLRVERFLNEWHNESDSITAKTSGSTGEPKEITLKKSSMILSAQRTLNHFKSKTGSNAFLCLSPETIAGKMMIVRSIVGKLNLFVGDSSAKLNIPSNITIDLCAMVPMQLMYILENTPNQLDTIRINLIGGGPISSAAIDLLHSTGHLAYHTFGMTETISHIALRPIGKITEPHFTVLPDVEIDEIDGKLIINDHLLDSGPIETNDLIIIIDDSHFEWIGRADFVILSGGKKFYAEEIEMKIQELITFPFFISALDDVHLGQRVVLCVESEKSIPFKKEQFSALIPSHEIPKEVIHIHTFVRTLSGKIDRIRTKELIQDCVVEKIL
jgi:O-succinylbenzoic acid--CoA ligase